MKSNLLSNLLAGLLLLSAVAAATLCYTYVQSMRKVQRLQAQAVAINQNRTIIMQLLQESAEYGKTNAAMARILGEIGINLKSPSADAAAKPEKK